jgi:hypothetical protein
MLKLVLKYSGNINCPVMFQFRQNSFKQEVKNYCLRSVNLLILFGIRKICLISGRSLLFYRFIRTIKLTVVIIVGYHCYQYHTKCYPISFSHGEVSMQMILLAIIKVGSEVTD